MNVKQKIDAIKAHNTGSSLVGRYVKFTFLGFVLAGKIISVDITGRDTLFITVEVFKDGCRCEFTSGAGKFEFLE